MEEQIIDINHNHQTLDALQSAMETEPQVDCPLVHRFTKGMYIREISMPADTFIISKVHKTQHPFVISKGVVDVFNAIDGTLTRLEAPYTGITEPGTRRLLYIVEDAIWTTFHPNPDDINDVDLIEERIIEKRDISLGEFINNKEILS